MVRTPPPKRKKCFKWLNVKLTWTSRDEGKISSPGFPPTVPARNTPRARARLCASRRVPWRTSGSTPGCLLPQPLPTPVEGKRLNEELEGVVMNTFFDEAAGSWRKKRKIVKPRAWGWRKNKTIRKSCCCFNFIVDEGWKIMLHAGGSRKENTMIIARW